MAGSEGSELDRLIEVGAYWRHKITLTAVKLDLFTFLFSGPREAGDVARHYGGDPRAFALFLNALAGLGLLEKHEGEFVNTPFALEFLVRSGERYKGDQLVVDDRYWELWGRLEEALMTGRSPLEASLFHADPNATERLVLGLHRDALEIAPGLAGRLHLGGCRSLLDLGGGSGTYSIAFCQRNPKLKATILDLPNTTRVTRAVVKEWSMEGRIQVLDGDFLKDPIPGTYDAVFMSNILHGQGPEENMALLAKVYGSLHPRGRVIVQDVVMEADLARPQWGAVFAVNMLLHTGRGRCYSFGEIAGWLAGAGFVEVQELEANSLITAERGG